MMKRRHHSIISRIHRSRLRSVGPILRGLLQLLPGRRLGSSLIPMLLELRISECLFVACTFAMPHFFTTRDLFCHNREPPTEICYREPSAMTAKAYFGRGLP